MRKIIYIMLILCPFIIKAQFIYEIFYDDFNDNSNNWSILNDSDGKSEILNGVLSFECLKKSGGIINWGPKIRINTKYNFRIEASIKKIFGIHDNGFGLYFGAKDNENGFKFTISGNGELRISKDKNNINTAIKEWAPNEKINQNNGSINKITVQKMGNKLTYLVNENIVFESDPFQFYGDLLGFVIFNNQKIEIDYIKITTDSKISYYSSVANTYNLKNEFAKAIEQYDKLIEIDPTNAEYYYEKALIFVKLLKNTMVVIAELNKAIELDPRNSKYLLQRGFIQELNGLFENAIEDYGKCIEINPINLNYYRRARLLKKIGRIREAIEDYSKIIN